MGTVAATAGTARPVAGRSKKLKARIGAWCTNQKKGFDLPDAELPDALALMLNTKLINSFTGAAYTVEEVADMDYLLFEMIAAYQRAMNPPKKGR